MKLISRKDMAVKNNKHPSWLTTMFRDYSNFAPKPRGKGKTRMGNTIALFDEQELQEFIDRRQKIMSAKESNRQSKLVNGSYQTKQKIDADSAFDNTAITTFLCKHKPPGQQVTLQSITSKIARKNVKPWTKTVRYDFPD